MLPFPNSSPSVRRFLLALLSVFFVSIRAHAGHDTRLTDFGQKLCDAKGEGIFFERYDNGEVKASVSCGEYKDEPYVKQARYFDAHGRGLANEQNVPQDPSQSRYLEWIYDAETGPPIESRLYDGTGKLIEKKPFVVTRSTAAAGTSVWIPGTYNDYLEICRTQPEAALRWTTVSFEGRQFFEDGACPCLAEKAVRVDEDKDPGFMKAHGLDPASQADRLTVAAARSLSTCLCQNVVPGSQLQQECRQAAAIEQEWRPRD